MASDEHQPVMVKATYADGTVYYYDSALHAHATHFDGAPVLSITRVSDDEPERVESPATPQQVALTASEATDAATAAKDARIAELEADLAALRAG